VNPKEELESVASSTVISCFLAAAAFTNRHDEMALDHGSDRFASDGNALCANANSFIVHVGYRFFVEWIQRDNQPC
jgi:hypothetical protein